MEINTININQQENYTASKIFEKARSLFNTIGVRNTTMDELAKELSISKKTLYKEFKNKADLVKFCVQYDIQQDENTITEIAKNAKNAIEELLLIGEHINAELELFHPSMLHDLVKFYPESWKLIENHKNTFVQKNISTNIKNGIAQGFYRKDLNIELATTFQLHLCFLPLEEINSNYKPTQVYQEILRYNLYAIATTKGIEEFQKLTKKVKLK